MSKHKKSRCDGDKSELHRYKRYITANGKPVWHCVDCASYVNFDAALIHNKIRCHDCGLIVDTSLEMLHTQPGRAGITKGVAITCMLDTCSERAAEEKRKSYADEVANRIRERILSRSESEQDIESISLRTLIQEDRS